MGIKCNNCGGKMVYDIKSKMLKCNYCNEKISIEDFKQTTNKSEKLEDNSADAEDKQLNKESDNTKVEMSLYKCTECGAEILSYSETATVYCPYCNKQTFLQEESQTEQIDKIIPFKKDKKDMKKFYGNYIKKKKFVPKDFKDPQKVEEFRGIYIPHFMYTVEPPTEPINVKGTKNYTSGSYDYHEEYNIEAKIDKNIDDITFDASEAFDDTISSQIAPFKIGEVTEFNEGYIAGFYADKETVNPEKYNESVKDIANEMVIGAIEDSDSMVITPPKTRPEYKIKNIKKAFFPVWFMTYRNKDRVGYSVANGQTGKMTMDIPVDLKSFFTTVGILSVIFSAIFTFLFSTIFASFSASSISNVSSIFLIISSFILFFMGSNIYKKDNHIYKTGGKILASYKANTTTQKVVKWLVLIVFLLPFSSVFLFLFSILSSLMPLVTVVVSAVIYILLISKSFKLKNKKITSCLILGLILGIITGMLGIIAPSADELYYGMSILNILGIIANSFVCIKEFNELTTRPVPNFFKREGADNRE